MNAPYDARTMSRAVDRVTNDGSEYVSQVKLSRHDVDLLRKSMLDLSHVLPLQKTQQHTLSVGAADKSPVPTHPIQSIARARSSPDNSSDDISEDIHVAGDDGTPLPQAATSQAFKSEPQRRTSRPLSSRAQPAAAAAFCTSQSTLRDRRGLSGPVSDCLGHAQSAAQVVKDLGQGAGVLHQLQERAESLDGARAAALENIVATLKQAQKEGADITHFLVDVLQCANTLSTALAPQPAAPAQPVQLRTPRSAKASGSGALRLPRGLEPRGLTDSRSTHASSSEWRLRLLAGYDDAGTVGLAGIAFYDVAGVRIPLAPEQVSICNAVEHDAVAPLISGEPTQAAHQQMWTATLPSTSGSTSARGDNRRLEVVICLPQHLADGPATLKVWNHSASNANGVRGVKWMAVLQGDAFRWHGIVNPSDGGNSAAAPTIISLQSSSGPSRSPALFAKLPTSSNSGMLNGDVTCNSTQAGVRQSQGAAHTMLSPCSHTHSEGGAARTMPATLTDSSSNGGLLHARMHTFAGDAQAPPPVATPSLADTSSDVLLAELHRRGIVVSVHSSTVPTVSGADATPPPALAPEPSGASSAATMRSHAITDVDDGDADDYTGGVVEAHYDPGTSQVGPAPQQAASPDEPQHNRLRTDVSVQDSQAQTSSFGPPPVTESPGVTRRRLSSETDAAARELVLSADSQVATMPGLGLSVARSISSGLSGRLSASQPGSTGALSAGEGGGEDICLADAVRRKADAQPAPLQPAAGCPTSHVQPRPPGFASTPESGTSSSRHAHSALPSSDGPASSPAHVTHAMTWEQQQQQQGRDSVSAGPLRARDPVETDGGPLGRGLSGLSDELQNVSAGTTISVPLPTGDASEDDDILGELAPPRLVSAVPTSGRRRLGGQAAGAANENRPWGAGNAVSAPLLGRRVPPIDLNQSLDSLTFFQRHNRGRLAEQIGHSDALPDKKSALPRVPMATATLQPELPPAPGGWHGAAAADALARPPQRTISATAPLPGMASASTEPGSLSGKQEGLAFLQQLDDVDVTMSASTAAATGDLTRLVSDAGGAAPRWPDPAFVMPIEPAGCTLELLIYSTWGDVHYVGLSAIEVFDAAGKPVVLADRAAQVTAEPHSVNVLPESTNDPRIPENLFDGVNCTCSDLHQWLTPFTPGAVHTVRVDLGAHVALGMLRVWNYNKSRIHSQRGARQVEMRLDGACIFQGDVSQAPGEVHDAPAAAECLVFTTAEAALDAIERHDAVYEQPAEAATAADGAPLGLAAQPSAPELELVTVPAGAVNGTPDAGVHRPRTSAAGPPRVPPRAMGVLAQTLTVEVLATWGDADYLGLTSLHVIGADGDALPLTERDIEAVPRDLNDIPGVSGHDRTLDKLLDGEAVTTDDRHMWLAPCATGTGGPLCVMTLSLGHAPVRVQELALWNYNKDLEGTARGVAVVRVLADGRLVTPVCGVVVPKAPGTASCDFGCTVPLTMAPASPPDDPRLQGVAAALLAATPDPAGTLRELQASWKRRNHNALVEQDCLTPPLPVGIVLKLVIWSTWGDPFYVGLSALEVHDAATGTVHVDPARMGAEPLSSVAMLPTMGGDARTLDKLVNGNTSGFPAQSWLAPRPKQASTRAARKNVVVIRLPHAVAVSKLRIWNYYRNPERGACEVDIYLDDQLIYLGYLRKARTKLDHQTIVFTNEPGVLAAERHHIHNSVPDMDKTHLTLIDEKQVKRKGATYADRRPTEAERPTTAIVS